ncbi:hypothetical protein U6A24_12725 [Aquimarina gracilis]|uniref:Uncharacterized protein n=1 Tax=Aquimarina gracilis TaxID=874422 RepID=A0ABU5ZWT4_9FLAO|nr:hypothetical protein [Aquimarina gracilis]MEB3346334.1 hypothetical protein [Aquimarina gracilis]
MKKVTIVASKKHCQGKSFLIKNMLLAFQNPVGVFLKEEEIMNPFIFSEVTKQTDVIAFHNCSVDHFKKLCPILLDDKMVIEKRGHERYTLSMPKVIIEMIDPIYSFQRIIDTSLLRRISLIEASITKIAGVHKDKVFINDRLF